MLSRMEAQTQASSVRLDRWLWAARMYKARSLAAEACVAGHVKVNDASAKPARPVRVGDLVEALTPGGPKVLAVLALAEKRGPAAVARALYEDRTPPPLPTPAPVVVRDRGAGRPSKRERRQIDRLREQG